MRQEGNYIEEVYDEFTEFLSRRTSRIQDLCRSNSITFDEIDTYPNAADFSTVFEVKIALPDIWVKDKFVQPDKVSDLPDNFVAAASDAAEQIKSLIMTAKEKFIPDDTCFPLTPYGDFEMEDSDPHILVQFEYYNPLWDPAASLEEEPEEDV